MRAPSESSAFQRVSDPSGRQSADHARHGRDNPDLGTIKPGILVLGGDVVARGVVAAALEDSRPVVLIDDRPGAGDTERSGGSAGVVRITAALRDDRDGAAVTTRIRALDVPLAGVVATTRCTPRAGRVLDHPADELRNEFDAYVLPQLTAARHLLPLLADGGRTGSYLVIAGPGGERPWSGYGYRSVAAAALQMLALVLRDEARSLAIRVQLLAVTTPVRTAEPDAHACPEWPSAVAVGRHALQLIERSNPDEAALAVVRHPAGTHPSLSPFRRSARHVDYTQADSTTHSFPEPSHGGRP